MQHHYPAHWSIAPVNTPRLQESHWANTAPAVFDALLECRPSPFREALNGLQVRELDGDEVFHRYFAGQTS